jgi:hypothetical protein
MEALKRFEKWRILMGFTLLFTVAAKFYYCITEKEGAYIVL